MSRAALAQSAAILLEAEAEDGDDRRFVDLCVSLRICDVDLETRAWREETDEELIRVGGRWDRRRKRWSGDAKRVRVLRVHRGQEKAARWIAEWFRRAALGPRGPHWKGFRRVWTQLLIGGRRGGKTHLACVALCMFAVLSPGARVWAISPTQEETDELEQAVRGIMPRRWYRYRGGGAGKPLQFMLPTGARILCLSGHKPRALKRGRVDFALYNEAQNQYKAGWIQLRGAIADNGGLVVMAANPPDAEIGRWIENVYERARAEKNFVEAFDLTAKENPFVEFQALADIEADVNDELTYRREVLGEFVPIGDVVLHAWSDSESVLEQVPTSWVDVTAEVTKAKLGRAFGYVIGMDFQKTPHMAASIQKFFRDPAGPPDEVMQVAVDEVVVEDADESDLLDALETRGRWTRAGRIDDDGYRGWIVDGDNAAAPVHCAVVMDASGWWQDGAHNKGKTSELALRARRWRFLYKPQAESDKNPDISERVKATNARCKAKTGRRRFFSLKHNEHTNRAMRSWENRGGAPYKKSVFVHVCDAVTYPIFRFFGKPRVERGAQEYRSVKRARHQELKGW